MVSNEEKSDAPCPTLVDSRTPIRLLQFVHHYAQSRTSPEIYENDFLHDRVKSVHRSTLPD